MAEDGRALVSTLAQGYFLRYELDLLRPSRDKASFEDASEDENDDEVQLAILIWGVRCLACAGMTRTQAIGPGEGHFVWPRLHCAVSCLSWGLGLQAIWGASVLAGGGCMQTSTLLAFGLVGRCGPMSSFRGGSAEVRKLPLL